MWVVAAQVLRLQASLLNYAIKSYPGNLDYINHCISNCAQVGMSRIIHMAIGLRQVERGVSPGLNSIAFFCMPFIMLSTFFVPIIEF